MPTKDFVTLTKENIDCEHICCAFSDKKCAEGYQLKKDWLKNQFQHGYVFKRLDERAKVFIEYGPSEFGWVPVNAPDYLIINCFWVSGQYKGQGYAKALLKSALEDAANQGKNGIIAIAGLKKMHFMSDGKWLLSQGFEVCDTLPYGICLLVKKLNPDAPDPKFNDCVRSGECENSNGLVAYYSNRCPFTEHHVNVALKETAAKRNLPLEIIKLDTPEKASSAPTPATIFSLFYNGKFVTTDASVCMDNRFDKIVK